MIFLIINAIYGKKYIFYNWYILQNLLGLYIQIWYYLEKKTLLSTTNTVIKKTLFFIIGCNY